MKYIPPFRIENGSIYEFDSASNAYIHIYLKSQLTKSEYQYYQKQISIYDANYDKQNKGE